MRGSKGVIAERLKKRQDKRVFRRFFRYECVFLSSWIRVASALTRSENSMFSMMVSEEQLVLILFAATSPFLESSSVPASVLAALAQVRSFPLLDFQFWLIKTSL